MRDRIFFFLLVLILALGESTVFPFRLVLPSVLSWAVLRPVKSGLFWAFLTGLILDLVKGQALGLTSLIFLLLVFLLNLYKVKFKAGNLLYLLPFTLLSAWFDSLVRGEVFSFLNLIFTGTFLLLIWLLLNLLITKEEDGLQLELKI